MVEIAQSGFECPIIIKRNNNCVTYADVTDDGTPAGNIVIHNGFIFISANYAPPFNSWANIIAADPNLVAFICNRDVGVIRLYDGTQVDEDNYIDPLYDATGLVTHWEAALTRPVKTQHEVGNAMPADLRETVATFTGSIDKLYSSRWRTEYSGDPEGPAAVTPLTGIKNPIGFTGIEALIDPLGPTQSDREGYSGYYTVILMARDNSDVASGQRGNPVIFPCCKFSDVNLKVDADGVYAENLKFTALDMVHVLRDVYQDYTKVFEAQA